MPYIEGESLRDRMNREGQLTLEDSLHIGRAVAGALDYAHRNHIVHRDIKPENIMLNEGEAMVMDFGIAKAVSIGRRRDADADGNGDRHARVRQPRAGRRRDRDRRPQRPVQPRLRSVRDAERRSGRSPAQQRRRFSRRGSPSRCRRSATCSRECRTRSTARCQRRWQRSGRAVHDVRRVRPGAGGSDAHDPDVDDRCRKACRPSSRSPCCRSPT